MDIRFYFPGSIYPFAKSREIKPNKKGDNFCLNARLLKDVRNWTKFYASSDYVDGPLVIVGRPDSNLFWQEFNTPDAWAYFDSEKGKYFIRTCDGREYRNETNISWAIVQLIWDSENERPVLLIGGLDMYATRAASYWFADQIDQIIVKNVHTFILKIEHRWIMAIEYTL